MVYPKIQALVDRLYNKTKEGNLTWEETSRKDSFQTVIGGKSIVLKRLEGGDAVYIVIDVFDEFGTKVETFSDEDVQGADPATRISYFDRMSELYETARRMALGTEKVIDAILADLDDENPF